MPGRIARSARPSGALSSKSSAQTLKSAGRNSSPVRDIPDEGEDSSLRRVVYGVFGDAQRSTAGHRKLVIQLRKVQEACCYEPVNFKKARWQGEDFDESAFNTEVVRCVLRVLAVKKAESVGDRVVRFLGTYLNTASGRDNEIINSGDPDTTSVPETPTSRLTTQILQELLPKLSAKDKVIRFRATQITSHIINSLDTLDDSLFHQLRFALLKRIHDKEAMVRLQAVYGLGRLAAEVDENQEDDDSDSDGDLGSNVLEKLLSILQNDPAPEVRRNLLLNLPLTKDVLPYLLERARDADGATRRALYARLLPALGDFRHLSLTHREKLLRWGLRDRDENVRKATARLFRERWIEDCAALPAAQVAEEADTEDAPQVQKPANQAADPSLDALLELLERIDVVNSGIEGGIALTAMHEFWDGRADYVDYVSFPDEFWDDLNPELAFVARTFNDFCRDPRTTEHASQRDLYALVEEKLPEVTKFGFFLQRQLEKLIETMRSAASGDDEDAEDESVQQEFIVEQLLHMALTFDYSDEVGRRKMFGLARNALAVPDLPEEAARLIAELLRLVCGDDARGEKEFCAVVLEAIAEVHDTIMGEDAETTAGDESSSVDESFHSATSHFDGEDDDGNALAKRSKKRKEAETEEEAEEKAIREIMVNMKCLHIALCMLQNVGGDLEADPHLVMMLNNLVVPAVRSKEAPIRERGLLCLGLCCLLRKVKHLLSYSDSDRDANTIPESGRREPRALPPLLHQRPSRPPDHRPPNHRRHHHHAPIPSCHPLPRRHNYHHHQPTTTTQSPPQASPQSLLKSPQIPRRHRPSNRRRRPLQSNAQPPDHRPRPPNPTRRRLFRPGHQHQRPPPPNPLLLPPRLQPQPRFQRKTHGRHHLPRHRKTRHDPGNSPPRSGRRGGSLRRRGGHGETLAHRADAAGLDGSAEDCGVRGGDICRCRCRCCV